MLELNSVDIELYQYALQEFQERITKCMNSKLKLSSSTFTSYAQNFEDVMLWRALKHVEKGFYIDVGAQHPVIDSVSKAFYERGWRGVHIEPIPEYAELLRQDRPDETVLQIALSDREGTLDLSLIPNTGLSTAVDAYAQRHQTERGYAYQRIQVPVLTLKTALQSWVDKPVHWLKIDVEGFEAQVLKGWDSQALRPWIMVVEATIPYSTELDYKSWHPLMTSAGYEFVYFDGLNRFYVAKEHATLAKAFSVPPNVSDEIQLSGQASSGFCRRVINSFQVKEQELVAQAEAHTQWLQNEWDAAKQRIESLSHISGSLETELVAERERATQLEAERQHLNTALQAKEVERQQNDDALHAKEVERQQIDEALHAKEVERQQIDDALHAKEFECQHLESTLHTKQAEHQQVSALLEQTRQHLASNRAQLQAMYASLSWKITAPLRFGLDIAKVLWRVPSRLITCNMSGSFDQSIRWGMKHPKLVALAHCLFRPFPSLCAWITHRVGRALYTNPVYSLPLQSESDQIDHLSVKAARVLRDLKLALRVNGQP